MIEFLLSACLLLLPLFLATAVIGMTLSRGAQVQQVNRVAARMLAAGVDLSSAAGQNQLLKIAGSLSLDSSGNGVIILSEIRCLAAGQAVCARRITIGNSALSQSAFAQPTHIGSYGVVDYTVDPDANANSFFSVLPLSAGATAFVAEAYYRSPDLNLVGFRAAPRISARAIF